MGHDVTSCWFRRIEITKPADMELARFYVNASCKAVSMNPLTRSTILCWISSYFSIMLWTLGSTNEPQQHRYELSYSDFHARWMLTT